MSADRTHGTLPLDRYAALGDGRSVALLGEDGAVDWWCVPRLDSPPLLDRLLEADPGGYFAVTPDEPWKVSRAYRPDSNVVELLFTTARGTTRLTWSLNTGVAGRLPWSELAVRVEGLEGTMRFGVAFRPGTRDDTASPWTEQTEHGPVLHLDGVLALLRHGDDVVIAEVSDLCIRGRLTAAAGARVVLAVLAVDHQPLMVPTLSDIDVRIDRSDAAWREWTGQLGYAGRYADAVRRSALALKLLEAARTGSIAAAATTSLPERLGGPKNFDYRFAWIRDATLTITAMIRAGAREQPQKSLAWLLGAIRANGPDLDVFYTLEGGDPPAQRKLDSPGYGGSRPVVVGNSARGQTQLGIYADIFDCVAAFTASSHVLDPGTAHTLAGLADRCADCWRKPDAGIWELHDLRDYTMSKIGCWVALDRAADLADGGHIECTRADRWRRERDRVGEWIDAHCWSDAQQSYVQYPGADKLDASLLLAVRFGFDRRERLGLTRAAIEARLCRGPLMYRMSGMEQEEGCFIACSFWRIEAMALLGDVAGAIGQMDALLLILGGNLGLMNEMIDPDTHAMLGNMPQGLSHLALIHAACAIDDAAKPAA